VLFRSQDNDGTTWNSYHTLYWPTFYLIDKRGKIRYTHIGEGQYEETEAVIQTLLAEPASE
jgi:cytochrome oxidase Cu insertion factor (SCO1/SenC/PrrC family)